MSLCLLQNCLHYLRIKCLSVIKCQQLSETAQSHSPTCQVTSYMMYISETQKLYIADTLLWKLDNYFAVKEFPCPRHVHKYDYPRKCQTELNTSELIELLQHFAVEHLTTYRQVEAREFGSVVTTVTTDFEAVYAYKRGDYQRCLQLSTQNVHKLLYADLTASVPTLPEFIQLLDDDIVSLTALTLIVNPERTGERSLITQLTLSLYLMIQRQLKLHCSLTSLRQTLRYTKVAYRRHDPDMTLDQLALKLSVSIALLHLKQTIIL